MFDSILLAVFLVAVAVALIGRQLLTGSIRKRQGPIQRKIATPWRWWFERTGQLIGFAFVIYALVGHEVSGTFANYSFVKIIGACMLMLGVVVHLRAKYDLGVNWTNAKDGPTVHWGRITEHGLYQYSRNPMYTSTLSMVLGVIGMTQNAFVVALWIFLFVYFYLVIIAEEALLWKEKGQVYVEYRKRVRRFL